MVAQGQQLDELPASIQRGYRNVQASIVGKEKVAQQRRNQMAYNTSNAEGQRQSYTMNQVDDQSMRAAGAVNRTMKANATNPVVMTAGGFNDQAAVAADYYDRNMQDAIAKGETGRAVMNYGGSVLTNIGRHGNGVTSMLDSESTVEQTREGMATTALNVGLGAAGRSMRALELTPAQAAKVAKLNQPIAMTRRTKSAAPAAARAVVEAPKPSSVFGKELKVFGQKSSDVTKAGAYLDEHLGATMKTLSKAEESAATNYKLGSGPFNHGLRNGTVSAEVAPQVKALKSAIDKSRIPEDMMLSRTLDAKAFESSVKGGVYRDAGFSSTRVTSPISTDPSKVTLRILAPKGTRALPLDTFNKGMTEAELLLPPGAKMQVVKDIAATSSQSRVVYVKLLNP